MRNQPEKVDPRLLKALAANDAFVENLVNNRHFMKLVRDRVIAPYMFPDWVLPAAYERMSGVGYGQVISKKRRGVWVEGIHWRLDPDGGIWINWRNCDKWVANEKIEV